MSRKRLVVFSTISSAVTAGLFYLVMYLYYSLRNSSWFEEIGGKLSVSFVSQFLAGFATGELWAIGVSVILGISVTFVAIRMSD